VGRPPTSARDLIRTLGTGKWGNEVFWYMFGKTSRRHGLELQVAPWVGNALISAVDPPCSVRFRMCMRDDARDQRHGSAQFAATRRRQFTGYFQYLRRTQ
jgi:hypothetical protein